MIKLVFIYLYSIVVVLPLAIVATAITSITTTVMSTLFGDSKWGYLPPRLWSRFMCAIALVNVKVTGRENIVPNQSYIFVANHQSIYDIFLIYGFLEYPFKWIMKKEIQKIPLVGKACEAAGHIFINRTNPKAAAKSIELAAKKLTNGNSVVIFPEGTRSKDGEVGKFKRGAFMLATDLDLDVVPLTIKGAFEVMPPNSFVVFPGTIELSIHKPMHTDELTHQTLNPFVEQVREVVKSGLN